MTEGMLLIIMLVLQLGFICVGVPVMYVLLAVPLFVAAVGVVFGAFDAALLGAIPTRMYGVFSNQILYAVPLFIVMGKLLEHSGMATRLLASVTEKPNGNSKQFPFLVLGICLLIAASTGVVGATITMLVSIALPALLASGLSKRFSAGLICAGGSLGQIVPPSIVLILLSDQVSNANLQVQRSAGNFAPEPITVGHLFAGSVFPALALFIGYVIYLLFSISEQKPSILTATKSAQNRELKANFSSAAVLAVLLMVPIVIIVGVATPTEAGALGAFVCLIWCVSNGNFEQIRVAFQEAVELTGIIFGIVLAASVFALVFRGLDGDAIVSGFLTQIPNAAFWALICVMALVFLLGFFLEFVEITYIIVPLAAPMLFGLGVDPVWFAILMAVNLQISFLTPPMGIALFYYKSAADIETLELYRSIIPYVLIQILVLVLIFCYPPIATWLPTQLF